MGCVDIVVSREWNQLLVLLCPRRVAQVRAEKSAIEELMKKPCAISDLVSGGG